MKVCTLVFPVKDGIIYLALKKLKIGAGLYNGWGGKLIAGDQGDIFRAAVREFSEESCTATTPSDLERVAVIDFFEAGRPVFECHVFFCNAWEGELQETAEMGRPEPFPLHSLPYEKMMPGDKVWLERVIAGEKIRAHCFYSDGNTRLERFDYTPL